MWWKRVLRPWLRRRMIDEAETQPTGNSLCA